MAHPIFEFGGSQGGEGGERKGGEGRGNSSEDPPNKFYLALP